MSTKTMTTHPMESTNELIKHGPQGVDSNMNPSKYVQTVINNIDKQFDDHHEQSLCKMNTIKCPPNPRKTKYQKKISIFIQYFL